MNAATKTKAEPKSTVNHLIARGFSPENRAMKFAQPAAKATNANFNLGNLNISAAPTAIQPKLTIGAPNDKYEQEADSVADKIMRMPEPQVTPQIQRMCSGYKNELSDKNKLQAKPMTSGALPINANSESQITSLGSGQPLPVSERNFFEPRFNQDFSNVRIHSGTEANSAAKSINARAFTLGRNITFANEQYQLGTIAGRRLMAHELTHVVQQQTIGNSGLPETIQCVRASSNAVKEVVRLSKKYWAKLIIGVSRDGKQNRAKIYTGKDAKGGYAGTVKRDGTTNKKGKKLPKSVIKRAVEAISTMVIPIIGFFDRTGLIDPDELH